MRPRLRPEAITWGNRGGRLAWKLCWALLYRPSPVVLHAWRRLLLRAFGARIGARARPYPSARIWAPWNLAMERDSCIGPDVDCYCVDRITLGAEATVSQYSYLCAATRDVDRPGRPLMVGPITIGAGAWIAADVFVGPGVVVGANSVVGARSSVFGDIPANCVAMGSPARRVRDRNAPAARLTGTRPAA